MFFFFLISCSSIAVLSNITSCNKEIRDTIIPGAVVSFESNPAVLPLAVFINEASGIADSKINPGYLWVEEDSGNPPSLYLLNHSGATVKSIYLKGATNRDWEDLALSGGPDASKKYLYIGEIGDNNATYGSAAFYRFEEPAATTDTVRVFDVINFAYADGPRDAEAFLVDGAAKDIYIITKRESKSRVYKLAWPYSTTALNNAVFMQELPYTGVVSAALSNDGRGIIVKTYTQLYYYSRAAGETLSQTLLKSYSNPAYVLEPQGEAVTFALDNSGFYTLSEKGFAGTQALYFYKKK